MPDWNSVSELILHHLSLWLKWAERIFSYSGLDLLRGSEGLLSWTSKSWFHPPSCTVLGCCGFLALLFLSLYACIPSSFQFCL
jgi:hypothetical protein